MKALTKGQYEGIASVLARVMDARQGMFAGGLAHKAVTDVIETLAHGFADQFQESDPEFKRELFLKQCGVTE
jgi:hypothetical protein